MRARGRASSSSLTKDQWNISIIVLAIDTCSVLEQCLNHVQVTVLSGSVQSRVTELTLLLYVSAGIDQQSNDVESAKHSSVHQWCVTVRIGGVDVRTCSRGRIDQSCRSIGFVIVCIELPSRSQHLMPSTEPHSASSGSERLVF